MPGKLYVPEYLPEKPPSDPRLRVSAFIGALFLVVVCLAVTVYGYNANRGRLAALRSGPPTQGAALPQTQVQAAVLTLAANPTAVAPASPQPTITTQPSPTSAPTQTASPQPSPTLAAVSPECEQGYLFALGRVFPIEVLAPLAGGGLRLPQAAPEAAYFVDGSASPNSAAGYAFFLNDTPENQALLDTDQSGSLVSILWRGCLLEETSLLGVQLADADQPPSYDPALPGVTLFVTPSGPAASSLPLPPTPTRPVSTNTPVPQPAATAQPTNTPAPTIPPPQGAVEAEIGFLGKEVTSSTIMLTISVYNYGPNAFTLYSTDVLLIPPAGGPVPLDSATPALPAQFPSGASQTFSFSFSNPGGSGIVFQIFNVEFDIDDF